MRCCEAREPLETTEPADASLPSLVFLTPMDAVFFSFPGALGCLDFLDSRDSLASCP